MHLTVLKDYTVVWKVHIKFFKFFNQQFGNLKIIYWLVCNLIWNLHSFVQYHSKAYHLTFKHFQESIYSVIEKHVKTCGKLVQKRNKGNSLRFQLLPLRESSSQTDVNQESSGNDKDRGPLWLGVFVLLVLVAKYVIFKKYMSNKAQNDEVTQTDSTSVVRQVILKNLLFWKV